MKLKTANLITLADFFRYGRGYLVPKEACAPYRYMEFLLEICLLRKYKPASVLDVGSGTDSFFKYLEPADYSRGAVMDFNPRVVDFCKKNLDSKVETIMIDMEDSAKVATINQKWDYIVCNSVIEHIKNDSLLVNNLHKLLNDGGVLICSTALHPRMYNAWDHAVGHYRRYSVAVLKNLFANFNEAQIIQSSMLQEIVRPLFFGRIKYLAKNTIEENNKLTGDGFLEWGRPPYAKYWPALRFLMPLYLLIDWAQHSFFGGIGFVIARK